MQELESLERESLYVEEQAYRRVMEELDYFGVEDLFEIARRAVSLIRERTDLRTEEILRSLI